MPSFYLLSLVLSVFLLSFSRCQAQRPHTHEQPHARHRRINNLYSTSDAKTRRDANAVFTYFIDGQGACGATNGPDDFIVAINSGEYEGGAHCFEMITITANGKTTQAQITDQCSTCSFGGLDLSQALFEYFAPLTEGTLQGSWSFNSDITTSTSPPSTTSYTPTPTTIVTATTSSASTSAVSSSSTTTTTSVPTSTPQGPQTIAQANLALLELSALLEASFKLAG